MFTLTCLFVRNGLTFLQANGKIDFFDIDATDMDQLTALDEYLVTDWDPVDTD